MKKKKVFFITIIILFLSVIVCFKLYYSDYENKVNHATAGAKEVYTCLGSFLTERYYDFDSCTFHSEDEFNNSIFSSEAKYTNNKSLNDDFKEYIKQNSGNILSDRYKYIVFIENGEITGALYSDDILLNIVGAYPNYNPNNNQFPYGFEFSEKMKITEVGFNRQAKYFYNKFIEEHKDSQESDDSVSE